MQQVIHPRNHGMASNNSSNNRNNQPPPQRYSGSGFTGAIRNINGHYRRQGPPSRTHQNQPPQPPHKPVGPPAEAKSSPVSQPQSDSGDRFYEFHYTVLSTGMNGSVIPTDRSGYFTSKQLFQRLLSIWTNKRYKYTESDHQVVINNQAILKYLPKDEIGYVGEHPSQRIYN